MPVLSTLGAAAARGFGFLGKLAAIDEYFEYVTMLLPGNGTNGAQNNTFLDSSTNNFTITRNGNTTQGTFAPYGANWSNYFDGSGDQLTAAANNAFVFGTGDFCIEGFFFVTANSTSNIATIVSNTAGGNNGWIFSYYTGGFRFQATGILLFQITSSLNTWHHVVICRASGTTSIFIDGVRQGTTSTAYTWSDNSTLNIGYRGADAYFTGYMSNVRLVKGSSVYDPTQTTITVPTAPLTAITNTSLLTCQSNRFIDNSANNFTITRNGDVSVQVFSPFSPTASYAAGTNGGSGYFDGTGDTLSVPDNTALEFGSGDFTIETFFYTTSTSDQTIVAKWATSNLSWYLGFGTGLGFYINVGAGAVLALPLSSVTANQWNHIAVTRSGADLKLFVNGTQSGSTYNIGASTILDTSASVVIGRDATSNPFFTGYISNVRILKGTAQYTANFTPPTAPLTAITNTSLLLNYTNAGVIDNAMMNNLETVGNAQISTTQSKWGGSSIAFDGTGDALSTPANVNLAFGTGDFTIEMWVYGSTANNSSTIGGSWPRFFVLGTSQTAGCIESYVLSGGTIYVELFGSGSLTFTASTLLNSTWNHFAATRSGTTLRLFVNGTQQTSGTFSTNLNLPATSSSWIGAVSASVGNFNGYIDYLRITKGFARYTANFTAPTAPFPTR